MIRTMKSFERVLAVGAHTDDVELGCGAYLSRLEREGTAIRVAAFSRAEKSLPAGAAPDTLEREFRASMQVLGRVEAPYMGTVPVRDFPEHRQHVLDALIELRRDFDPQLVLTMNSADTHQDHEVVHQESLRAFRGLTLLGYEVPWNQRTSSHDLFVEVSEQDVERKIAMLAEYRSQATLKRSYMDPTFVRSAAVFRGYQGRLPLAEVFEVLSMIWTDR